MCLRRRDTSKETKAHREGLMNGRRQLPKNGGRRGGKSGMQRSTNKLNEGEQRRRMTVCTNSKEPGTKFHRSGQFSKLEFITSLGCLLTACTNTDEKLVYVTIPRPVFSENGSSAYKNLFLQDTLTNLGKRRQIREKFW